MTRLVQWKQDPVKVKNIPLEGGQVNSNDQCDSSYAYVYAGHGQTDATGVWRIRLGDVNCEPPGPRHGSIPSIVATPTSGITQRVNPAAPPTPSFLVALINGPDIAIYSFGPGGHPEPHVPFSWHCVVEGELVD
jgi:hypothetical protein